MTESARKRLFSAKNGLIPGALLVDGFLAGSWRVERERQTAKLTVTPFAPLAKSQRTELEQEARRLLKCSESKEAEFLLSA